MANNSCGCLDPTVTDNELVWKAIEYAEVFKILFKINLRRTFSLDL